MTKLKRVLAATALAAVAGGALPASAGASAEVAAGPCQVKSLVTGLQEWYQEVLVTGRSAPRGAVDVELTCGVVRYGEVVAWVDEQRPGPVAVLADVVSVHASPTIGSCHVLTVRYVDGYTYTNTCP